MGYDFLDGNWMLSIYLIRGIMMKNCRPEAWARFTELQSSGTETEFTIVRDKLFESNLLMFSNFLHKRVKFPPGITFKHEDLEKLQGALKINAFRINKKIYEKEGIT